jgi:TolA-binding protein
VMVENMNAAQAINDGDRFAEKGDYERASNEFSKVLDEYFNSTLAGEAQDKLASANKMRYDDDAKKQLELAKRYYELGDAARALAEYRKVTVDYPNSSYARDAKNTIAEISKATSDVTVQDRYDAAFDYYQQRNYKQAIGLLQEILLKYPDTKQAEASRNLLMEIDKKYNDKKAEENYLLAEKYYESGEFTRAKQAYEEIARNNRDSKRYPYAVYGIAECYYCAGDYNSAIEKWQDVLNAAPEESLSADAAFHIADAYEKLGVWKSARNGYLFLIDNYPKSKYMAGEMRELVRSKLDNANFKLASEGRQ